MSNKNRGEVGELTSKMLIHANKKAEESLALISFAPEGLFGFKEKRWLKIYEVEDGIDALVRQIKNTSGRIRITLSIDESGRETCHLSLIENGEEYKDVEEEFKSDEIEIKNMCECKTLNIDEVMNLISYQFGRDNKFSYAAYVRGNRDWKKECFFEPVCEATSFRERKVYGESLSVLDFNYGLKAGIIEKLKTLGCPMHIAIDFNTLSKEEKADYKRALEKKYNRRLIDDDRDYINLSLSIVLLCDSVDARDIVEESLISLFVNSGYLIAPSFYKQKKVAESVVSFGVVDDRTSRIVERDVLCTLFGGSNYDA